jgi:hypothetical protein
MLYEELDSPQHLPPKEATPSASPQKEITISYQASPKRLKRPAPLAFESQPAFGTKVSTIKILLPLPT